MEKIGKIMPILLVCAIIVTCLSCTQSYMLNTKEDENAITKASKNNKPKKINVYIDNTISMEGYMTGGTTDFKSIIITYLAQISEATDSIGIYYVNNQIHPAYIKDKDGIYNYIKHMDIDATKGNVKNTTMDSVLYNVLHETKNDAVSIFISDCLYSPKEKDHYENQVSTVSSLISPAFKNILNNRDFAVTIYKFYSNFKGDYYDVNDKRIENVNTIRPFYLWVMGDQKYVKNIVDAVDLAAIIKGDAKYKKDKNYHIDYFSFIKPNQDIVYSILPKNSCKLLDKTTITELDAYTDYTNNRKKTHAFYLGLNFLNRQSCSYLNIDTNYLNDINNYTLQIKTNNCNYKKKLQKNEENEYINIYPYVINITSTDDDIINTDITFALKYPSIPNWIDLVNDKDGKVEGKYVNEKTFGFFALINAVYRAFTMNDKQKNIFEINIKVNQ